MTTTVPAPAESANARIIAAAMGGITLVLGLLGLFYPGNVLGWLGVAAVQQADTVGVLGEVRATFGGLFVVLGAFTLLAAVDPPLHRDRLLLVGCLWLGIAAGRVVGLAVDGYPGLLRLGYLAFEIGMGGAGLAAWYTAGRS